MPKFRQLEISSGTSFLGDLRGSTSFAIGYLNFIPTNKYGEDAAGSVQLCCTKSTAPGDFRHLLLTTKPTRPAANPPCDFAPATLWLDLSHIKHIKKPVSLGYLSVRGCYLHERKTRDISERVCCASQCRPKKPQEIQRFPRFSWRCLDWALSPGCALTVRSVSTWGSLTPMYQDDSDGPFQPPNPGPRKNGAVPNSGMTRNPAKNVRPYFLIMIEQTLLPTAGTRHLSDRSPSAALGRRARCGRIQMLEPQHICAAATIL